MPTLQEISEAGAAAAEKCVRESMAMDYAWLSDMHELESTGKPGRKFHELLDRKYAELTGDTNVNGGSS